MLDIRRNYDILRGVRKICYYALGSIDGEGTAIKMKRAVTASGVTQINVARRMGISRSRLGELLNGSTRYRWSEEIARRIVNAIKAKK